MHTECSGNGKCWSRDSKKCIHADSQISCSCFINGRNFKMNGYCKPVECKFNCELSKCESCHSMHPLIEMLNMYGQKYCPKCESAGLAYIIPSHEILNVRRCDICNVASENVAECERRHFKELNKILPITTNSSGRHFQIHSQKFGNFTPYGRALVVACYLNSDPPNMFVDKSTAEMLSRVRADMAEALRSPFCECVRQIASMLDAIISAMAILFSDCPKIHAECIEHIMNICIASALSQ